jgi:transcriptional regulator with XRE-family HTH domain
MTELVNILTKPDDSVVSSAGELNMAIASRIQKLRKARQFSFDQLAQRAGVSKGILVQIEQGRANPSISTLCRVAAGLGVAVAELVQSADPERKPVRVMTSDQIPELWTGHAGGSASLVIGSEGPDMLELWTWVLQPSERFDAQPHPPNTQELVYVLEGTLSLEVDGVSYMIKQGMAAQAWTDRPHAYASASSTVTRFTMVVQEPHPGSKRLGIKSSKNKHGN